MISVFLPTRKGSERVIKKNTREFCGIEGGLLKIKLTQLLKSKNVDEIILSTNDELSIKVALEFKSNKLKIVERPQDLALSTTRLIDLVEYVPTVCNYENILWTHVTSPFVSQSDYDSIIDKYYQKLQEGYDSLMTAKPLRSFIWDTDMNNLINRENEEKWPRSQDLKVFYEIDSAAFLTTKFSYNQFKDRIGERPFLYELEGIKSFDIDWEDDFKIAEVLYKAIYEKY